MAIRPEGPARDYWWVPLTLLLVLLMPSSQSLWIDESTTALYTLTPDIVSFATKLLVEEMGSDAQYPFGNFYYWFGARFLGTTEIALRALSAVWVAVAILILWRVGLLVKLPWLPVIFVCHPLVWYYGGEARPYTIQMACGAGLLFSMVTALTASTNSTRSVNALTTWGPMLCFACMLGVIPFALITLVVVSSLCRRRWRPHRSDWVKIWGACAVLLLLGIYYLWTLAVGKGAQTVGTWGVGFKNILFSGYELLGFAGFGPGRYELRKIGLAGGLADSLPGVLSWRALGIFVLMALYLLIGHQFFRRLKSRDQLVSRLGISAVVVVSGSITIMYVLAAIVDFPFWGRHLAPILPFIVFIPAVALAEPRKHGTYNHILMALLSLFLLSSSLLIRFHSEHARDDYRSAVDFARLAVAGGATVWWSASMVPALYYGLEYCDAAVPTEIECVVQVNNADFDALSVHHSPAFVVTSKPDLYDREGALTRFLVENGYRLHKRFKAFEVYRQWQPGFASRLLPGGVHGPQVSRGIHFPAVALSPTRYRAQQGLLAVEDQSEDMELNSARYSLKNGLALLLDIPQRSQLLL